MWGENKKEAEKLKKKTVGYTESINYRCLEDLHEISHFSILDPLNLDYCGKEQCMSGFRFGPFIRDNYVIHFVLEGKGTYWIGNQKYTLEKGQAFMIPPGVETVYEADIENPWYYAWIGFHGYKVVNMLEYLGFGEKNYVVNLGDTENISEQIELMLDARELTYVNGMKRMSFLYALFADMAEQKNANSNPEKDFSDAMYVKVAVEIIMEKYNQHLKISEIADKIGINRSYLTNIFKKEIGISPQMFLINYRLDKAALLLRSTSEPVGNVAISVGYVDSLSFSKAFKQKFGMNPSAYRKNPPFLDVKNSKNTYERSYKL